MEKIDSDDTDNEPVYRPTTFKEKFVFAFKRLLIIIITVILVISLISSLTVIEPGEVTISADIICNSCFGYALSVSTVVVTNPPDSGINTVITAAVIDNVIPAGEIILKSDATYQAWLYAGSGASSSLICTTVLNVPFEPNYFWSSPTVLHVTLDC